MASPVRPAPLPLLLALLLAAGTVLAAPGAPPRADGYRVVRDAVTSPPDYRIQVSPNPNAGRFRLEVLGTFTDTVELVIINVEGKKVYTRRISEPGEFLFNLTPLRQGIYFAQVREANQVVSLPIIYAYKEGEPALPNADEPRQP